MTERRTVFAPCSPRIPFAYFMEEVRGGRTVGRPHGRRKGVNPPAIEPTSQSGSHCSASAPAVRFPVLLENSFLFSRSNVTGREPQWG